MTKLACRHGVSKANDKNSPAYGDPDAGLLELGWHQAASAGDTYRTIHGIDFTTTPVATSLFRRTQETAIGAGALHLVSYDILNEATEGLAVAELLEIRGYLDRGQSPPCAIAKAIQILNNPPSESIWFTHGLVMIGLCEVLGIADPTWRHTPNFGEIRELPI